MRRLEACYFVPSTAEAQATWPRLVTVLARSAAMWCPGWDIRIRELPAPARRPESRADSYLANTYKLETWHAAIMEAADGDEIVLMDADMLVTNPIAPIWDQTFDVAYTERRDCAVPLNAGVVFVRVSPASRRFMALWLEENDRIVRGEDSVWRRRYVGVNQAALGKVLETRGQEHGATVVAVPCATWNCENTAWAAFDPETTRIVHVKDVLRQAVFGQGPPPPGADALVARWRAIDAQARGVP